MNPAGAETSGPVQVIPLSDHDEPFAATVTLSALPTSPSVSLPVHVNVSVPVFWQLTEIGALSVEL
ncbi:MAG TPA: hypothetical protein VK823_07030 [Streptosporangiaceae bacterium]|nr:hypothetical protein [Streptosporangiaceae bacterium]